MVMLLDGFTSEVRRFWNIVIFWQFIFISVLPVLAEGLKEIKLIP